jgi:hypothetical protein
MAFLTAKRISRTGVALLTRTLVLPMTVTRVSGEDFAGSNGDTVTVRVPVPGTASEQANPGDGPITYEDIVETPVDVTLAHLYHATKITDESLSLEIERFAEQVTLVQVSAVATAGENELAGAMNALAVDESYAPATAGDVENIILAARESLGTNDVPVGDRWLAVSPEVATDMLKLDKFSRVDASGDDSALRQAILGRIYGLMVVESNALTGGTAVAYHRSGFAFATRTPVTPRGAADSATATEAGIGLRQIFQYDPNVLSDASVISTFAGAALVDADRVFKFDNTGV